MAERSGRRRVRAALAAGAAAVAALAAGCVSVPSSGLVRSTPVPKEAGGGQCCQPILGGPEPSMTPAQVVSNFLLASADPSDNYKTARAYLTSAQSKKWQPGLGVTIVNHTPTATPAPRHPVGQQHTKSVVVTGQQVAVLTRNGQYVPTPHKRLTPQAFGLQNVRGQWLIADLPSAGPGKPSHELLLTQRLFHNFYQPRNLYFYGPGNQVLVPDPVFLPIGGNDPGTRLVRSLLHGPGGWLASATVTAFPSGARLLGGGVKVPAGSSTANVDLGMSAEGLVPSAIRNMAAQLVWTLTSSSYGRAAKIDAVKLTINGRLWSPGGSGSSVLTRASYAGRVPEAPLDTNLYYLTGKGSVRVLAQPGLSATPAGGEAGPRGAGQAGDAPGAAGQAGPVGTAAPAPGEAGTGKIPLSKIAVSPDGRYLAGVAGPATTLYVSDLAAAARKRPPAGAGDLHAVLTGSGISAPSWDRAGDVWFAATLHGKSGLWVLPEGQSAPVRVSLPAGGPVTAVRVAPDGVRVAMIRGTGANAHLTLGAVVRASPSAFAIDSAVNVGANVPQPGSLTWYDADNLLATSQTSPQGLWRVPVDGDSAVSQNTQAGTVSITAAGRSAPLFAGVAVNAKTSVYRSVGLDELWGSVGAGHDPVYAG